MFNKCLTFLTNPSKLRIYLCKIPTACDHRNFDSVIHCSKASTKKNMHATFSWLRCDGQQRYWYQVYDIPDLRKIQKQYRDQEIFGCMNSLDCLSKVKFELAMRE